MSSRLRRRTGSRSTASFDIAAAIVDGVEAAVDHISRYTTGHTEGVSATDYRVTRYFEQNVDAAAVMVNTSTAWTDGEMFGFGAEIGISTQKLHARGPMGLPELTSTKWVVNGDGQVRPVSPKGLHRRVLRGGKCSLGNHGENAPPPDRRRSCRPRLRDRGAGTAAAGTAQPDLA